MKNIFLIHGSFGHPEENWFPWLKEKCEKLGYRVFAPQFPAGKNQSMESWRKTFEPYEKFFTEQTIVVGHSLGPAFLLDVIEKLHTPLRAAFFVSSFINLLGNPTFDDVNRSFVDRTFNWERIQNNCKKYVLFHSDNDPYVPLVEAENIARKLDVNVHVIRNGGHLNTEAGYTTFPELLDEIQKVL